MKKLFFFKSSSSSSGNNQVPLPSTDKQVYWEYPLENGLNNQSRDKVDNNFRSPKGLSSKVRKPASETQSAATTPCLRRSLSFSSAVFNSSSGLSQRNLSCASEQSRSPSSSSGSILPLQLDRSSCSRSTTPERQLKAKRLEAAASQNVHRTEKPDYAGSSRVHNDSSGNSSSCSSNVSSRVLDLYIDGEQQQERSRPRSSSSQRNNIGNGNGGGRRPPRVQFAAPVSPVDVIKDRPSSCSFREATGTQLYFSSKDLAENGFGHESPRKLAKSVIDKLSHSHVSTKKMLNGCDPNIPITVKDVYGESLNRCSGSNSEGMGRRDIPLNEPYETINGYHPKAVSSFQKQNCFFYDKCGVLNSVDDEEDTDMELRRKFKEAEQRFLFLSEEIEQESFLPDGGFSVPSLVQTIRNLIEERISLALEVSAALQGRIEDRTSAKEQLRLAKAELDSQTRRLEKEKNEMQSGLEKELDRRSSDWSFKLEKYQSEEQRLRERVRELAEQNVLFQRELSSLHEREAERRSMIAQSELQLKDLSTKMEEAKKQNRDLQQNLSILQEKYLVAEEERGCIQRNYEEKEKECKELHKSITRLLRTCSEQEKTIDGLREGLGEEIRKKQSYESLDRHVDKLQMEQMRLTGVEQALRKEVESYKSGVDSLRHENINLLNRLKILGKEGGFSTYKLDQELWTRVCCLQSQGLLLLKESNQLCSKLLEFIKGKSGYTFDAKHGIEVVKGGLDGQFVVESDMKVQGFKRCAENLTKSLQTMSTILQEKSSMVVLESQPQCSNDGGSGQPNEQTSEESIRFELKQEILLTSVLRDKLYSKELEVEQLQEELATAVRGNDIVKCEVQNAMDTLSCATHKLKDLELQMLKKDDSINRLQNEVQESTKELTIIRGILPKVSEERDLMWEEVKQYSEKNMLLNSEVNLLKKKVETLDEDVLLKEGQITILKDTLGNKTFDLLASPESAREFLLE
ncbi:uncharacterized protein LOC131167068 [Malania oleifera]|uniref:uncharacterized protein LOC131167068 n=1 Tax=Malania oleifera TaxID=397392 RepID=UPI0025AE1AA0|nr:uncharacterized protein LOC131167068 [Malania oleifera]